MTHEQEDPGAGPSQHSAAGKRALSWALTFVVLEGPLVVAMLAESMIPWTRAILDKLIGSSILLQFKLCPFAKTLSPFAQANIVTVLRIIATVVTFCAYAFGTGYLLGRFLPKLPKEHRAIVWMPLRLITFVIFNVLLTGIGWILVVSGPGQ